MPLKAQSMESRAKITDFSMKLAMEIQTTFYRASQSKKKSAKQPPDIHPSYIY